MSNDLYDVVVIGGGAAGLSAALVLGRARRRVAVVDGGEPRNAPAAHMQGFLSRDGMSPVDLLAAGRDEAAGYGVELISGHVRRIEPGFSLTVAEGRMVKARRILIATGAVDGLPAIPGLRELWGKDFLHCPYCHGWEVRDQQLGLLATGPASVEHAQLVRQWSDDLIFFTNDHTPSGPEREQLQARGIRVVDGEVRRIVVEDDRLKGVVLADGRIVERDALFVRPSMRPRGEDLLQQLDCAVDSQGFALVDSSGATSTIGVWAAGNVANPRAQVITAAGEGSAAAIAINADLVREDVSDAMDAHGQATTP